MFVTEEEAAEIYAKACRSWYRDEAKSVVNSKIRALKARGDSKGVRAWTQVRHSTVISIPRKDGCLRLIHFKCRITAPSETVGDGAPAALAFLLIQSRATRTLSSAPALS